jgi:ABC-2 type transport system permease protein
MNTDSTATGDPGDPASHAQAAASADPPRAAQSSARLIYWSIRRELWEHRWLYIVPLIIAAVFLAGSAISMTHVPLVGGAGIPAVPAHWLDNVGFGYVSLALMLAYVVLAVLYCLEALHGERRARGILFWKSLPVSDLLTVSAKASVPIVILPLITFATIVATQGVLLLFGTGVVMGKGANPSALWLQASLPSMWLAMLYHLVTVHALYWAPFYAWMLLVSAWARRAPFLWATVPVAVVLILERLVFRTSVLADLLLAQLGGGAAALPFPPPENMPMRAPTLVNLGAFLASPGLWIGLAVSAAFLAAAARLRRHQGPI